MEMPEALELVIKGRDEPVGFACPQCGVMYTVKTFGGGGHPDAQQTAKQAAELHCAPKLCECGKPLDKKPYTLCSECLEQREVEREHARFEKAAKVSIDDYDGDYAVFWPDGPGGGMGEGFYSNLDELLEIYEDEEMDLPPYVWACKPYELHMDAGGILERAISGHHEDAYDSLNDGAEEELQTLLDFFCKKQNVRSWEPDYTKVVLLQPSE